MSAVAAIFDLDETLLAGSSGYMYFKYLRQKGLLANYLNWGEVWKVAGSLLLHQIGLQDPMKTLINMAKLAAGREEAETWQITRNWFNEMGMSAIAEGGRKRLDWHRLQGHIPVICSGGSQFSVDPIAQHLNIEHTIYTEWLVSDGRLTGELRQPLVYGPGKVHWMKNWAAEHNVDLSQSYFYSDHISDQPLLETVAYPSAVNPEPKLARLAVSRGWPVLKWY